MSSDLIPTPKPYVQVIPSHETAYRDGFQDGFAAADMSAAGFVLCGCGMVVLLLACGLLARHTSRLVSTLCRYLDRLREDGSRYLKSCLLPLLVCIMLTGCAEKTQGDISNPAPIPPTVENAPAPAGGNRDKNAFTPHDASYREDGSGQYLAVHTPVDTASGPRPGEPAELASLLEMKGEKSADNTAVSRMRPNAIREAAQLVTFQTAIAWRYGQLVRQTERHSAVMDAAFNFSPLLLTQGDALIMPPLIARSGASMRIEDSMTATAATSTYELLEPARYIAAAPHWREFLMMDDFPAPESPHPAVLPRNSEERAIWRSAVREAWAQGLAEADLLYADNVARMTRSYRGAMLYHLLTAQHLLSRIRTASSETGMRTSGKGNLLHIGQRVYRITAPSAFTVSLPTSPKKGAGR